MTEGMGADKILSVAVTELFIRGRKLNMLLVFISRTYFKMPKDIRHIATHFIVKLPNKRELQQLASNHSSDTEFKDFMRRYKDYAKNRWNHQRCYIKKSVLRDFEKLTRKHLR